MHFCIVFHKLEQLLCCGGPHTYRFSLISKEVNGGVSLLNELQTVSLIPAVREHVEAYLTSCRGKKAEEKHVIGYNFHDAHLVLGGPECETK